MIEQTNEQILLIYFFLFSTYLPYVKHKANNINIAKFQESLKMPN